MLLHWDEIQKSNLSSLLTGLLGAGLSLFFLFCWRRQPNQTEYAWYAGMLFGHALFDLTWYEIFGAGLWRSAGFLVGAGYAINLGSSYYFFRSYFGASRGGRFQWIVAACLLLELADAGGWVDWYSGTTSTKTTSTPSTFIALIWFRMHPALARRCSCAIPR